MLRRQLVLFCCLLLFASVALAKVTIDYDQDAKPGQYKTFQYVVTKDTSLAEKNPLMHDRIVKGVVQMMKDLGLQEVDSDPNVDVTYHVTTRQGVNINTTSFGYGYGRGWHGGMGTTSTTAVPYTEGTLIVDVWDAGTNDLVWRGTSTQVMKSKPEKREQQLNKMLSQMTSKWEKIRSKLQKE